MNLPHSFITLTAILSLANAEEAMRSWTDNQGRTINAKYVKVEMIGTSAQVQFMLADGKLAKVPLDKLSEQSKNVVLQLAQDKDTKNSDSKVEQSFSQKWIEDKVSFDEAFEVNVIKEDEAEKKYIYETPNFRFSSNAKLTQSLIKELSYDFETTRKTLMLLPIGVSGKSKKKEKLTVRLFETKAGFVEAGGSPDAASTYKGDLDVTLAPFNQLGVQKRGSSYTIDRSNSEDIRHTLTLQMLPSDYWGDNSPNQWLIHGLAGYVSALRMKNNYISFSNERDDLISFITNRGYNGKNGKNLGDVITIPNLEVYMNLPQASFWANHRMNYGAAALLFYYFAKIDGKGDGANLIKFMQALKNGDDGPDAKKILLAGRSYETLEKEIFKAYDKLHITMVFRY